MTQPPPMDETVLPAAWRERPVRVLIGMLGISPGFGLGLALVFMVKAAPVLLFPLFVEHVIAVLSRGAVAPIPLIVWPAVGLILLQLLNVPVHTLFTHMVSGPIRDVEHRLRAALIRQLQYLSISFFFRNQSGELQAKVLRDVEQVENLVRLLLTRSFQIALTLAFAIGVTLLKQPVVLLFLFGRCSTVDTGHPAFPLASQRAQLPLPERDGGHVILGQRDDRHDPGH